jgi:uncharacterized protein (UPF0332 family)
MEERLIDLSKYRLEKAKEDLETSKIMLDSRKFSQSINRSYYAMFHALRALLALDKYDSKKHSGIISYFNQNYIKTQIFKNEYSTMLMTAFKIRNDSDYNDFFIATNDDANIQYENAKQFLDCIKEYIEVRITNKK